MRKDNFMMEYSMFFKCKVFCEIENGFAIGERYTNIHQSIPKSEFPKLFQKRFVVQGDRFLTFLYSNCPFETLPSVPPQSVNL